MTDYIINFGISDERTVRWPFLLAALITLMVTGLILIADAEAATVTVTGQTCTLIAAYGLEQRGVAIDTCGTVFVCGVGTYAPTANLLVSGCSVDRIRSANFEVVP